VHNPGVFAGTERRVPPAGATGSCPLGAVASPQDREALVAIIQTWRAAPERQATGLRIEKRSGKRPRIKTVVERVPVGDV
jgi:hypothetical protein